MLDERTFAQIFAVISSTFPNFKATKETAEAYYRLLGDIPEAELKLAVLESLNETGREFAPTPGVIRGKVAEIRAKQGGVPSSFEAWEEVSRLARYSHSGKLAHKWSHPLVEKAARLMGFPRFMEFLDSMTSDRARFLECYQGLVDRAKSDDLMLPEVRQYLLDTKQNLLEGDA